MEFAKLKELRRRKQVVMILYDDDHVVYTDLNHVFDFALNEAPELISALVVKYGLDKAKKVVGWITELGNYWENGKIDADFANALAREWDVLDVLLDELVKLYIKKYFVINFET